jgi:BRCT domain type II-containing protein
LLSPSPDLHGPPPLSGQLVVFTGKLSSLSRKAARELVVRLGGATPTKVNARTTMLVVGAEGFGPHNRTRATS